MTSERRSFRRDDESLMPLLCKTDRIQQNGERIKCIDKLEVPLDDNGIPRRVALMGAVLNTIYMEHIWTGGYDLHHVAWPGKEYRQGFGLDGELIGAAYRGSGSLKVLLPRQLHNYVHRITEPPPTPDLDVMRQYALEHNQVDRLFETIRISNYDDKEHLSQLPFITQERIRYDSYKSKLEDMEDGQVGLMPDREYLAQLTISQARPVLRSIARVVGLSNARRSQKHFFDLTA